MAKLNKEDGILLALIERYEKYRLPRILEIREEVEAGDTLTDEELDFMEEVIMDARRNKSLVEKHPEWQRFCAYVIDLHEQIMAKALENEEKKNRR